MTSKSFSKATYGSSAVLETQGSWQITPACWHGSQAELASSITAKKMTSHSGVTSGATAQRLWTLLLQNLPTHLSLSRRSRLQAVPGARFLQQIRTSNVPLGLITFPVCSVLQIAPSTSLPSTCLEHVQFRIPAATPTPHLAATLMSPEGLVRVVDRIQGHHSQAQECVLHPYVRKARRFLASVTRWMQTIVQTAHVMGSFQ